MPSVTVEQSCLVTKPTIAAERTAPVTTLPVAPAAVRAIKIQAAPQQQAQYVKKDAESAAPMTDAGDYCVVM